MQSLLTFMTTIADQFSVKMLTFIFLFSVMVSTVASAQMPTIEQLWFHKNQTLNSFDTGIQKMAFPPSDGKEVLISIIGSGVDVGHPYLKDSLSKKEERNFSNNSTDVSDITGDGTHAAGVVASFSNVSPSLVFKKIKILPLKVMDGKGPLLGQQVISALNHSLSMGAKIVLFTISWKEAQVTPELLNAIDRAQKSGLILISAAGDFSQNLMSFPCAHKGVLCVGSIDKNGNQSSSSNSGLSVDFVAPGSQILSSIPSGMKSKSSSLKGYDLRDSTNASAAIIAAYTATMLVYHPRLSRDEIYYRLANAARERVAGSSVSGFPIFEKVLLPVAKDLPLVILKERSFTLVSNSSANIQFELLNLGGHANRYSIQYSVSSPDLSLSKQTEVISFGDKQLSQLVTVPLTVKNLMTDKRVQLEVKITSPGISRIFKLSSVFVMDSGGVGLGDLPGTGLFVKVIRGTKESYLYSYDRNKTLNLYRVSTKIEYLGFLSVPVNETPIFEEFKIRDFDGDGTDDFFWVTEKSTSERMVNYSTLSMKPKYSGSWILDQNHIKDLNFHFIDFNFEGKKIKVPFFLSTGSVSKNDVSPGDFSVVDPDRHLYWLEPRRENGKLTFITRTLSNEKFRNKVLSGLTVEVNSLLDLMVVTRKDDSLIVLGGVKDSEGITQSGISIEITSLDSSPKVKSIGFDRPLDPNGLLIPIESPKGVTIASDTLFISAPAANRISLFDIFNVISGGRRTSALGDLDVASPDYFVDVPYAFKDAGGVEAWVQSLYSLQLIAPDKSKSSFPLLPSDRIQRLQSSASVFVIVYAQSSGRGFSVVTKSSGKLLSPLKYSLRLKACTFIGESQGSLYLACESQGLTRIQALKPAF